MNAFLTRNSSNYQIDLYSRPTLIIEEDGYGTLTRYEWQSIKTSFSELPELDKEISDLIISLKEGEELVEEWIFHEAYIVDIQDKTVEWKFKSCCLIKSNRWIKH